ncbi:hypothetical protein N7508_011234 [Penicillium antarcticum]|uniref:uncharacterized protein n=1 Tax=Penicillium antarcticum TaxID=416450 RepID=UPI00239A40D8|nr:uncharacterized protein N7508_011234 [Penicillium antarcticum]KAJ5288459.1 hypothetical protein N7508_011234 [Penicillium antarcticum]
MKSEETGTFGSHDNGLDTTSNKTFASSVQSWLDRCPNTLESTVFSALSESPASHPRESLASQPRLKNCYPHEDQIARFGRQIGEKSAVLMSQVRVYEDLLRSLHPRLDRQSAIQIEKVISEFPGAPLTSPSTTPDSQQVQRNPIQPTDHTIEDLNRDRNTQVAGLLGRPSEVAWLSSLQCEMDQHMKPEYPLRKSKQMLLLSANYFLDGLQSPLAHLDDFPDWPTEEAANQLLSNEKGTGSWHWRTHVYFTRAWQLYTRDSAERDHPNLQQVQVESLISLYMLSIGHINRAVANVRRRNEISSGHGNPSS